MAIRNAETKRIDEVVETGRKNQRIIPRVKQWCKHIVLTDQSAGMIAEVYRLPMDQKISCPHTEMSIGGINVEGSAEYFIIENCRNCKFHQEVLPNNFGSKIIKEYNAYQEELLQKKEEEKKWKQELSRKIESEISKGLKEGDTTQESILILIQKLDDPTEKLKASKQLLEASKLKPDFFSEICQNVISLYFEDEIVSENAIQIIYNISTHSDLPPIVFIDRIKSLIDKGNNFDKVIPLYQKILSKENLPNEKATIRSIIENQNYERWPGELPDSKSYPNSINLLGFIGGIDLNFLINVLIERLKIKDKSTRINTNVLIQKLLPTIPELGLPLSSDLINSFEFDDDQYGDSADGATASTLSMILTIYPEEIIVKLDEASKRLSKEAVAELIRIYENYVYKNDKKNLKIDTLVTNRLIILALSFPSGLYQFERVFSPLRDIAHNKIELLKEFWDELFAGLADVFLKYKELDIKKEQQSKTAPAQQMSWPQGFDFQYEHSNISKVERRFADLLNALNEAYPKESYERLVSMINNLDSKLNGGYKGRLITLIKGVDDISLFSKFIPSLYNHLLDTQSKEVRINSIKILAYLLSNYDEIIPKSLIELYFVFLKNPDFLIRGKSIASLSEILRNNPDFETDEIHTILEQSLSDTYVIIHKNALRAVSRLEKIDGQKKIDFFEKTRTIEEVYFEKEKYDYCKKEVVPTMLRLVKEYPKMLDYIIETIIPKYCRVHDYYTATDFLEILTQLVFKTNKHRQLWFDNYFFIFENSVSRDARPIRRKGFDHLYDLKHDFIKRNKDYLETLALKRIENDIVDTTNIIELLSAYKFHDSVITICEKILVTLEVNKRNSWILTRVDMYLTLSKTEQLVGDSKDIKAKKLLQEKQKIFQFENT